MRATFVPAQLTKYTLADMAFALREGLKNQLGRLPTNECLAVAMAKCRGETANGNAVWNNNLGNIKCPESQPGMFTCIRLNEVINERVIWFDPTGQLTSKNGVVTGTTYQVPDGHPQTRMRAIENRVVAGHEYVDFIFTRARYAKARDAMIAGDPAAYSHELKVAGYYTAPEADYTKLVLGLYRPSLAFLLDQKVTQPEVPEKWDWHESLHLQAMFDTVDAAREAWEAEKRRNMKEDT